MMSSTDIKEKTTSVLRDNASKPGGTEPPTMNQNLQAITTNLMRIYDKLEAIEKRQSSFEKKISISMNETPNHLLHYSEIESSIGVLINGMEIVADELQVQKAKDETQTKKREELFEELSDIKKSIISVNDRTTLLYESIESMNKMMFKTMKEEYVKSLQYEMITCRAQLLGEIRTMMIELLKLKTPSSSSKYSEKIRYVGKDSDEI